MLKSWGFDNAAGSKFVPVLSVFMPQGGSLSFFLLQAFTQTLENSGVILHEHRIKNKALNGKREELTPQASLKAFQHYRN